MTFQKEVRIIVFQQLAVYCACGPPFRIYGCRLCNGERRHVAAVDPNGINLFSVVVLLYNSYLRQPSINVFTHKQSCSNRKRCVR